MTDEQQAIHESNETTIEARKRLAAEQAAGAYKRAMNRGATRKEADQCWKDCYETWMQE